MNQLILHIPHSSTVFPSKEGYLVDDSTLDAEVLKLTDWYTDDLFHSEHDITVKAEFSRIYCDVERFPDDNDEIMSKYGMGMLYQKCDDGSDLRIVQPQLRDNIYNESYLPHHSRFELAVKEQLAKFNKALIIDCHSFPDKPLTRDLNQDLLRPDFNIGTDAFHTPKGLTDIAYEFLKHKGFSILIDAPYSGSIVPIKYYKTNPNVNSIMIEINRRLYIREHDASKNAQFECIKNVMKELLIELRSFISL